MSHGITATDGMFSVRENAWHGLGVVFEDYPTRAQAQATAHPWEPLRENLFRQIPRVDENDELLYRLDSGEQVTKSQLDVIIAWFDELGEAPDFSYDALTDTVVLKGWYANQRSDNGTLLGVVSDKYTTVTNNELWDIAEALEQSGKDVMYETGGSLRGGAQVWALVRLKDPLVIKGDKRGETIPYFALQNSHDGSGSFRGQATMTRIVCMNTSQAADWDAQRRGTEFMFKHTRNVGDRITQAQTALSGWRQSITDWQEQAEELVTIKVTDKGVKQFIEKFIPKPVNENLVSEKVIANIDAERAKWLGGYKSITGESIENTAYGLVQASTEYANWARAAHNAESRFKRTFLSTDRIIADSITLAKEASKVDA